MKEDNASRSRNGSIIAIIEATEGDYPEILKIMNGAANSEELKGFVPPQEITVKFLNDLKSQLELKAWSFHCGPEHEASRIRVFH